MAKSKVGAPIPDPETYQLETNTVWSFPDRGDYNQVANFALTETSINISISNKPPMQYMAAVGAHIESGLLTLGEITDAADRAATLAEHASPSDLAEVTAGRYREFLIQRRKLMAGFSRRYFEQI